MKSVAQVIDDSLTALRSETTQRIGEIDETIERVTAIAADAQKVVTNQLDQLNELAAERAELVTLLEQIANEAITRAVKVP